MRTGTPDTRLIMLRGNSGSGKSTVADELRRRYGRGIAIVGQDNVRRIVLKEATPGLTTVGLVDVMARHILDQGWHVIVEGIYGAHRYSDALRALAADHVGTTACFYFDLSFEETVRRHATRAKAGSFGADDMRGWWRPDDVIDGLGEKTIGAGQTMPEIADMVMTAVGLDVR
ncbi:AAA family ATPase [Streptomyces sp. NPDC001389]|uniref:AAA family ATPase n=1 Tax=Streptomyces sp. NPDC001389 TaxID=3364569 RepID=UPI003695EC43